MKKKVVVAMSGGVDSSVTAALLKEQGYDVFGVTMRLSNWQETEGRKFGGCCGSKDFYDARSVAQTLGIPHYSFDYVEKFRGSVIGYFKDSYLKGETPNPCIACNQHVKFDFLLEQAVALGADYLATGHYARIERTKLPSPLPATEASATEPLADANVVVASAGPPSRSGGVGEGGRRPDEGAIQPLNPSPSPSPARGEGKSWVLKKALDNSKDQSYVLYGLGQRELSRLLFPLGDLTKTEVREIARRAGLRTADKRDSYEICFVPNEDYRQFISEEVPSEARPAGPIRHVDGRVLGRHKGLPFYTIGQREGLGVAVGSPLYVARIDTATNTLVVGGKEDVLSTRFTVREVTWVTGGAPELPCEVSVKIRSRHADAKATISNVPSPQPSPTEGGRGRGGAAGEGRVTVTFVAPQSAVTPGQAAVFYNGDVVLGGGIIDNAK